MLRWFLKCLKSFMSRYSVSKTPVQLFESLAFNIPLAFTDRQSLLEAPSVF